MRPWVARVIRAAIQDAREGAQLDVRYLYGNQLSRRLYMAAFVRSRRRGSR